MILAICFLAYGLGAVAQNDAKTFFANDCASFRGAINAVNARSGGDTIKITGNIVLTDEPDFIERDVTVTADTNPDGTPKFTINGAVLGSSGVFSCFIQNYFRIENVIIDQSYFGISIIFLNTKENCEIKINNCEIYNSTSTGIAVWGMLTQIYPKITISNCKVNNNRNGIMLSGIEAKNDGDIKIMNCTTNNSNGTGSDQGQGMTISVVNANSAKIYVIDCISNGNKRNGFTVSAPATVLMKNCVARNNTYFGFNVSGSAQNSGGSILSNCDASDNRSHGFNCSYAQLIDCKSVGNRENGFYCTYSILNRCFAANNGLWPDTYDWGGHGFRVDFCITANSTAFNNKTYGMDVNRNNVVVNSTFNNNRIGIYTTNKLKVYNSIAYGNAEYDVNQNAHWEFPVVLYNTVSDKDIVRDELAKLEKHHCTAEDPNLQGRNARGDETDNPDEIAFFTLGEGSSATELADKSLITMQMFQDELNAMMTGTNVNTNGINYLIRTITEEYVNDILLYDQNNSVRTFTGDRYDAGAFSGEYGGAPSMQYVLSYSPKKAANYGKVMMTLYGLGFHNDMAISLKKQGESDIKAETVNAVTTKCNAVFDLGGKSLGKWDIVVDFGDETVTIKNGFELEEFIEPEIEAEIFGTTNIRIGAWTTYTVKYTNLGNANAYMQPVIIELTTSKEISVEVKEQWEYIYSDGAYSDKFATINGVVHRLDTTHNILDPNRYSTYITPLIPVVPPYHTGYLMFNVRFNIDGIADDLIEIRVYTPPPFFDRETDDNSMLKSGRLMTLYWDCMKKQHETAVSIGWEIAKVGLGLIPGVGCGIQIAESIYDAVKDPPPTPGTQAMNVVSELGKIGLACATSIVPMGNAAKTAIQIVQVSSTMTNIARHASSASDRCAKKVGLDPRLLGSLDPNDKIGPVNELGSTYFIDRDEFTYIINFENDAKATAPAAEVWITDELDLNVYDINTFEAGIIKIGNQIIETPPDQKNYKWTVDMRPEKNLITEIKLTLDKTKGIAKWYFKSIDPETGELPEDALLGFLPPNDDDGAGQGFVMFTIKLKQGLPNDVVVANKASIVFDHNEAIITDEWVNKKDVVAPTSAMLAPVEKSDGLIELRWQGADNTGGSGIYGYDVFVKQGNGEYELLLDNVSQTTWSYTIDKEVTYSFYTIATDNAGNRETKTQIPDITYHFVPFVAVSGITGVAPSATAGTPLALSGTVNPNNATHKTIVWSVASTGATGATITGATFPATSAGAATVRATIANGKAAGEDYTQDFTITVSAPTGYEISESPLAIAYPNPTSDAFFLSFEAPGEYSLTLTDATGRVVLRQTAADQPARIDISHLARGVYMLMIDNGKKVSVMRIVKD